MINIAAERAAAKRLAKASGLSLLLAIDGIYTLALAVGIWAVCLFMYHFDTAKVHYITQTLLFGTAYMVIGRMVVTAFYIALILKQKDQLVNKVSVLKELLK
jgi:hypothetical protein